MNQTMTIKEFADVMGTTEEAIKWHIRKEYPDLMQNGIQTRLDQIQVTNIKSKMTATSGLVGAKTELEIIKGGFEYIQWMQSRIFELEKHKTEAQPKIEFHDAVTSSEKCFTMSEAVKLLNLTLGRNKFFMFLRAEKILNHDNEPYQQYIDQNYFRLTLKHVGHGGTEKVPLVTGKGLAWLQKRYDHIRLKEVV